MLKCRICSSDGTLLFDKAVILKKYEVFYFKCSICGFVQTEDPYWLDEAYSDAIGQYDIGLVDRNLINLNLTRTVVALFFDRKGKFLDYGGGYGLFVRMMRDKGFDFYLYEPNCENLFAKSFEITLPTSIDFQMLTAFEVFEHLKDPMTEVEQMLKISPNIFFSTMLLPDPSPKPSQWWYYSLDGGQHISLFSRTSLNVMAERLNVNIYSNGRNYHLLTKKKIPPIMYHIVMRNKISRIINQFIHQPSLLALDYYKLSGNKLD